MIKKFFSNQTNGTRNLKHNNFKKFFKKFAHVISRGQYRKQSHPLIHIFATGITTLVTEMNCILMSLLITDMSKIPKFESFSVSFPHIFQKPEKWEHFIKKSLLVIVFL